MAERIGLEPVVSTNLGAYGYNPEKKILAVQFAKTGVIFHYADVSLDTAGEMGAAESKGKFYAANIRGKFPGQRMTGPCPACGDEGWIGDKCEDCGCAEYEAVPYNPKEK